MKRRRWGKALWGLPLLWPRCPVRSVGGMRTAWEVMRVREDWTRPFIKRSNAKSRGLGLHEERGEEAMEWKWEMGEGN